MQYTILSLAGSQNLCQTISYFLVANTCSDGHLSGTAHDTVELAGGATSAATGVAVTVTCTTAGYGLNIGTDPLDPTRGTSIQHDLVCESNGDILDENAIPECDGK